MNSKDCITQAHGAGGVQMNELIESFGFEKPGGWENTKEDAATYALGDGRALVFTSDSYTVDPIFFPDSDIGHLAVSGTINDLAVMGADPLGLSLSLVIEEGFPKKDLAKIIDSIKKLCKDTGVAVVTGDTKVMGGGTVDKIVINTAGVGIAEHVLNEKPVPGDRVILSAGIGEHAVALLSKRFDYETSIVSDSKPLLEELRAVRSLIKTAKDPTRGGLAAALNGISRRYEVGINVKDEDIPVKEEARGVAEMLGLDIYTLACEGRFVAVASKDVADKVVKTLRRYDESAQDIGEVVAGDKVVLDTFLGKSIMNEPSGEIVPRIC